MLINMQYVDLNAFDLIAWDILQRNPVAENGFLIHIYLIAAGAAFLDWAFAAAEFPTALVSAVRRW